MHRCVVCDIPLKKRNGDTRRHCVEHQIYAPTEPTERQALAETLNLLQRAIADRDWFEVARLGMCMLADQTRRSEDRYARLYRETTPLPRRRTGT